MIFSKKNLTILSVILLILITGITFVFKNNDKDKKKEKLSEIKGEVIKVGKDNFVFRDDNEDVYTFNCSDNEISVGQMLLIEYLGVLNKKSSNDIVSYSVLNESNSIPKEWQDSGIFSDYYQLAYDYLKTLTLDEKIGQLLLVRVPENNQIDAIKKYNFGGYILFARDINGKTKSQVVDMIKSYQDASKTPMLIATDEEGGTVVRVSSNTNLAESRFLSPQDLYKKGGFDLIYNDTINKSKLLNGLGINVNLAPVADVSTNPTDYIYGRSFGQNTELTSKYVEKVIEASKGDAVSYTLKHFPGYSNNSDTHTGISTSDKSYEDIVKEDLPPFEAGIKKGAEAVLVSHNIVKNIDDGVLASLSKKVNNVLRNDLGFTGVVMTDDLDMQAVKDHSSKSAVVDAIKAGNDLLIVTDYEQSVKDIKSALDDQTLTNSDIEKAAFKVLAWKYYKLLFAGNHKS